MKSQTLVAHAKNSKGKSLGLGGKENLRDAADLLALSAFVTENELKSFRCRLSPETPEFISIGCLDELAKIEESCRSWKACSLIVRSFVGLFGGMRLPPLVQSPAPRFSSQQKAQLAEWKACWTQALQIWVDAPSCTGYDSKVSFLNGISDVRVRAFVALLMLKGHAWTQQERILRAASQNGAEHASQTERRGVPHERVYELWLRIVSGRLELLAGELIGLDPDSMRAGKRGVRRSMRKLRRVERQIWERLCALNAAFEVEVQAFAFAREVVSLLSAVNSWLTDAVSASQLAALCTDAHNAMDLFLLQIRLEEAEVDDPVAGFSTDGYSPDARQSYEQVFVLGDSPTSDFDSLIWKSRI